MRYFGIGVLLLAMTVVQAAQSKKQGHDFATGLLGNAKKVSQTMNPNIVPGFQTATPEELKIDSKTIDERVAQEAGQNKIAQSLKTTAGTRESYKIDPESNPLFIKAAEVMKDPEKVISETIQEDEAQEQDAYELKTCEEGGGEYTQSCRRHLEITLTVEPAREIKKKYCHGHWKNTLKTKKKYCKTGCKEKIVSTIPKKVIVEREVWVDGCQNIEKLADQGLCRYVEKQESQKNETKIIQGESIKRDHFEETFIYSCHRPVTSGCEALKAMGCEQYRSTCKTRENGVCVVWEQTYKCSSKTNKGRKFSSQKAKSPFCLTGNCVDSSYESNGEILEAITQLSVLQEAQKNIQANIGIFEGKQKKCSKNCVNFKDCCGTEKGWGTDIGLASCTPEEKELATFRKNSRCVRVGTFCAQEGPGFCLRKETSFCCFGNKLAKIIQEQGREQLKIGWGSPQHPDCRALTTDELSRLDFSKMDLKELYEDVRKNFKEKDPKQMSEDITIDRVKENMKNKVGGSK